MADAFSLAVNMFTLLELGRKFAILALTIHKDGKDAVSRVTSLDLTSEDLSRIAGELGQPSQSSEAHNQGQTDERIHQLARRCVEVAAKMQDTISGLGLKKTNRKTGNAVVKAFKYKWKQGDIVAFQSELEDLRSELMLNLILWLRTGMTKSLDNQDRMIQEFSELRTHDAGLKKRLNDLGLRQEGFVQQIIEILLSNATSMVQSNDTNRPQASLETDLMNAMLIHPQKMEEEDVARLQISPNRLARVRNQFIGMFWYDSMFDREASVAEAHPDTLKWIFRPAADDTHTWNNFSQWLGSEERLYWITGKMGSGKSTLMKYISEELPVSSAAGIERRCIPHLLRCGEDQRLCIATFYFWAGSNEETRIQTSVEGMYRTLLTQILDAYPESAPRVSPRRWENLCLFNQELKPPGIAELKVMLRKAVDYVSSMAKVCLFIDGLDEFQGGNDDMNDLINWVKTLVETSPVKLCVASRPWRVFEDALQDRPHLRMEDFNFKDIQQYVWRRFHNDLNFMAEKQMHAAFCNQLLDDIVTKAEGVFLWVYLVCTSLLQAMSRGDLVGDLRQVLNELPAEMEKLYGHILDNLDLKDCAAKYLLLLQAFLGRPDALVFSFADDIGEDSEFSFKLPKESLKDAELQYRFTKLSKRLNSRCRGLLSLSVEALDSRSTAAHLHVATIQYCHRSAKDYLEMGSIQSKLISMLDMPFDPHLRLCSAYLARKKCYTSDNIDPGHASIYSCAEHSKRVASESNDMMIRVLDDLNPDFDRESYTDDQYFGRSPWFGGNILSLTVVLGVREYVKCKVGQGQGCVVRSPAVRLAWGGWAIDETGRSRRSLAEQRADIGRMQHSLEASRGEKVEWPLLLDALLSAKQPNPEIVSLLLENGADSNLIIRCADWQASALDVVLFRLRGFHFYQLSSLPDAREAWVDSLCLLLQHGAKPDRSDVQFLRSFVGEGVIQALKLPHLGRHREVISRLSSLFGRGRGCWEKGKR